MHTAPYPMPPTSGSRRRFVSALALAAGLAASLGAQERSAADLRRQDLNLVRFQYVMKTRSMTPAARERALALLDDAEARAATLSKPALHMRLLEVVGLADNGHDTLTFGSDAARPDLRMPYRVGWFADGLVILRATGAAADLAGGRIEAIDGLTPADLYQRLAPLAGGIESQRRLSLGLVLESPQLLFAAKAARQADRLSLRVRMPDGTVVERTVQAMAGRDVPRGVDVERLLAPDPVSSAEGAWRPALAPDTVPLAYRNGNDAFRLESLLGGSALYVQFRTSVGVAGQDIEAFQRRVLAALQLQTPSDVILDLRFDAGSDLQGTLPFMRSLPERVPGKVYVLMSHYTFAAGIVSAAAVKKAGGEKVVLVGEAPGDRLRFWSEGGSTCLPGSGFCLHYTDGLFDLEQGCEGTPGCYGGQFDVEVGRLDAEMAAPLTAADYLAARDSAMESLLANLH